ncbi:MAG: gliding motility-associated C-terminal domain-containing protein [Bacteroidetes bacterium]|nr:gliding motility-associated C-terminal domain-containing protein [Bacteroidota bacterium]
MKRFLLPLLTTMLLSTAAMASHIAGGELFYDYLGGNNFRITLKLYRNCGECAPGQQCAAYDSVAYIHVFDAQGNYLQYLSLPEPPSDTIPSAITNSCMDLSNVNVCIEQAFYTGVVNLPPRPGGYTLVYQRCCRNSAIQTISPNTGSTYVAHISNDLFATNSSPRFAQRPPLFICSGYYLQFDNSATDPDGDSLVYSLVNALDGADGNCPSPGPQNVGTGCPTQASAPPYNSVVYLTPYGATNPLNSPSSAGDLTIDPSTGLLTGTPNQTGIFVVAVAVAEYRNGVYIGQVIRDYQFNVVPCNIPTVTIPYQPGTYNPHLNIGVYELNCTDRTVNFNNISTMNPPPTNVSPVYHWDFGVAGINSDTSNLKNPAFTYPDTGTYTVTVIIRKGICVDSSHALVRIYPTLTSDFSFVNVCQDSAVVFHDLSVSTSSPLDSWSWIFGDGQSSGTQNPAHIYSTPGTYSVTLTARNVVGCAVTATHSITVKPLPVPDFSAPPACLSDSVHFTYTGTGPVTNYYWNFGNGGTSTQMNPVIKYSSPGTKTVSLITVTSDGCRDTVTKSVIVYPLPSVTHSPTVKICPNTSTQLSETGGVSYSWSPGTTLSDSTISNPIATPTVSTVYHVTVTDGNGCRNFDSVTVNTYPNPQIDAGPDTSVCKAGSNFHTSVQLTATGGVSYTWTPAAGLSSTTIPNPVATPPAGNQTYYVTGTDTNGCRLIDSVTVYDLDPALNLIVDTAKAICQYDTTTLNVLKQGNSYYNWSPNVGISDPNSNSPFFFPLSTTTYIFTVQNYCYSKQDTATVVVHLLPPLTTEHIDSVCIGDTVQIHASGADIYHWRADATLSDTTIADPLVYPVSDHMYYVTGTETTYGCKNRDSVLVHVYPLPLPGIGPDVPYICQGHPIQLLATGGVDYQWQPDPSLSSTTIADPTANPMDTDTYHVRVFNIHQCHADTSITINVQLPVQAVAQSPYDVCEGKSIRLYAAGGFYYQWYPSTWINHPADSSPVAIPLASIVYHVRVSNDCFSDTAEVDITIRPLPIVDAGLDTLIYRNTPATLSGTANVSYIYWYPGQYIESPFQLTTPATPLHTTTYYLYAISEYGCSNYDSVLVTVDGHTELLLPTAFSPNDDGLNDVFRVARYLNIETLKEFAVYDRWGAKVFSTQNINIGWDGRYNGHDLGIGTYVWTIAAKTYDGEDIVRSGNVTLVR